MNDEKFNFDPETKGLFGTFTYVWLIFFLLVLVALLLYVASSSISPNKFSTIRHAFHAYYESAPRFFSPIKATSDGISIGLADSDPVLNRLLLRLQTLVNQKKLDPKMVVKLTPAGLVIDLNSTFLFQGGFVTLGESAKWILYQVSRILDVKSVSYTIEGHTDDVPIETPLYPSNWDLSAARSAVVLRYLVAKGIDERRMSLKAYAQFRPLIPKTTPEARERNRRVTIVVVPQSQPDRLSR